MDSVSSLALSIAQARGHGKNLQTDRTQRGGSPVGREHPQSDYFIGEHALIQRIQALVRRVAATDATVLITGESGTGKEVVARSVHTLSARTDRPFVPINCAAIPHELSESELFGHARGAFTGAHSARAGMFQLAEGGTIFLDQIGEIPLSLQPKLLRRFAKRRGEAGGRRPLGHGQCSNAFRHQ